MPDQVAEVHSPDFSGEHLLVCLNSDLKAKGRLEGLYLVRTNVGQDRLVADMAVVAYNRLAHSP